MTSHLWRVVAAELIKLRSLPAVPATVGTTVAVTAGLAFVAGRAGVDSPADVAFQVITYAQAGFILLGVLTVAAEYGGGPIRTTLAAVPGRVALTVAKLAAYVLIAVPFAAVTVVAACRVAGRTGVPVGATAYLVLVGALAFAVALLVRGVLTALGIMLTLAFAVSPLLATLTEYAAYLPDLAGARMFRPGPPDVLTPGQGAVVMAAWVVCLLGTAVAAFAQRDA
ncbi:ABC transporter permease [Nonomuraea sp. B12E4]|uniref:ABC transporter permease n=1 Tax=Nonomuraea sp. B12E4 TaxID=3153564 RepID=UPI00325E6B76